LSFGSSPLTTVSDGGARRRGRLRPALAGAAMVVVAVLTSGCLPPLLDPPTSGLSYGKGPLDAIRSAADTTVGAGSACGLTETELAAMVMVPTFFEAGGPVPSPMALSRWDNVAVWSLNANLFAFGQTSGPYVSAFFSPGIGLWQFDSAGGWDLTAADSIDAVTSANTATSTIAYRFCTAPPSVLTGVTDPAEIARKRRRYAWGPWFGCSTGNQCEDRYRALVTNGSINSAQDLGVDRYGGMQQRTCNVAGLGAGLTCWYVDPANAQGSTGWRGGTYDPARPNWVTPLPKPFYVVRANGREYRIWIRADTGFDIGITASRPVTSNARTSLQWENKAMLCDTTAGRGECASDPFGSFDVVSQSGPNRVRVAGWAFDPDTAAPIAVHVYVGTVGTAIAANVARSDVDAVIPGAGPNHGFDAVVPGPQGPQQVCAYAINAAAGSNALLGCRTITVTGPPVGSLDVVSARPGKIAIAGWTAVPGAPDAPAVLSVDGVVVAEVTRTIARADVARVHPWAGPTTGFSVEVAAAGGPRRVCLTSGGAALDAVTCRTVTLPSGSPIGALESVTVGPGSVTVLGWVVDPDLAGPIDAHVWIGPLGVAVRADRPRTEVAYYFPAYGPDHGYLATIPVDAGPRQVCVFGFNQGLGSNQLLGCRNVVVPGGSPIGALDAVTRVGGSVVVSGWAIDPDTAASIAVHVYVGSVGTAIAADQRRPDVAAAFPGYGELHGFTATLPAAAGAVNVCVYAIETKGAGSHQLLGCRTV